MSDFLSAEPMPESVKFASLRAVPAFAIVGFLGFLVDSGVTSLLAWGGLSLALARPPGVVVATIFNFALNRRFTFQATHLPIGPAFFSLRGLWTQGRKGDMTESGITGRF